MEGVDESSDTPEVERCMNTALQGVKHPKSIPQIRKSAVVDLDQVYSATIHASSRVHIKRSTRNNHILQPAHNSKRQITTPFCKNFSNSFVHLQALSVLSHKSVIGEYASETS